MLQLIRRKIRGVVAYIVVGIIIVPFALFGIDWLFSGLGGASPIASINSEVITQAELEVAANLKKRQLASRSDEQVDFADLDDNKIQQLTLSELVERKLLGQQAAALGMDIPPSVIDQHIIEVPQFQVAGVFVPELYQSTLRDNGYTPTYYKNRVRQQIQQLHLISGFTETAFVTNAEVQQMIKISRQERDLAYVEIALKSYMEKAKISTKEVQAYYDENPNEFMSERQAIVDYVEIKREDFYLPVSDDVLRQQYDVMFAEAQKQRRAAHILVEFTDAGEEAARDKLADIKRQIDEGADFEEMAREYSDDIGSADNGGLLGTSVGDTFPASFEQALSQLEIDEVSDIVVTEAGLHLIKRLEVGIVSFEESVDDIRTAYQQQQSQGAYIETVEQLDELAYDNVELAEIAEGLALTVKESEPFSVNLSSGIFANNDIIDTVFGDTPPLSENSPLTNISDDHALVYRIQRYIEPKLKEFAEVKEVITKQLKRDQARMTIEQIADDLLADAHTTGLRKAAKKNNHKLHDKGWITRSDLEINTQIIRQVFVAPCNEEKCETIDRLALDNENIVVIHIKGFRDGDPLTIDEDEREEIAAYLIRSDGDAVLDSFNSRVEDKAQIDLYY